MSHVAVNHEHLAELIADLEAAHRDFVAWLEANPEAWDRGRAGKWSVGQHAEHVAAAYAAFLDRFVAAERELRAGRLGPRPWRDPLQALFVRVLTRSRRMPRGGRAPSMVHPAPAPERAATLERLGREVARFRALDAGWDDAIRERIWVHNPFMERWHYTWPELVRVQAQHTRHHAMLAREATDSAVEVR